MNTIFKRATAAVFSIGIGLSAAVAETVDVTLLLVNDIYDMSGGRDRGGFARLASVVNAERAKGGNLIYTHAGDSISPSLLSGFDQGEHIIELLNMAPPDIFVPGNHEFDFGEDVFRKRMSEAKFPLFAANLRDADGNRLPGFEDQKIVEFGTAKIGIVGLAADDSQVKSSPGSLEIKDSIATGTAAAAALREAGADIVVAVAHSSRAQDRALFDTRAFDIILTGDDHDLLLAYDGRTVMAESSEEGDFVTAIDVSIDITEDGDRRRVSWRPQFRVIDTATVEPDPEVAAVVAKLEETLSEELDVVIGSTSTPLDSRRSSVRTQETAIGNLIADAMRVAVGAEVAITNGGGIRGNTEYPAGAEISRRMVITELPFGNKTLKLEITGAEIRSALENGLSQVENTAGRFPQISGMTVTADLDQPAGSRVKSVSVGNTPLDDGRTYTLATNDYMARGGDGYRMFRGAKRLLGALDAKLMANDVMVYVRKAGTVAPTVEGRLTTE